MMTSDMNVLSHMTVRLIDSMGNDASIVQAARVSVLGENKQADVLEDGGQKLIRYLMREKHGSPFEHNSMKFFVAAPIFVFREFHRHRMASYNEVSGRYKVLEPNFYIPDGDRKLVNAGSSAKPEMVPGNLIQFRQMEDAMFNAYEMAWHSYKKMIDAGIANEVARAVLPVGLYSEMYVTMNLRSIMNFLSLRTHVETAAHVSRPQREIEMVAEEMEKIVSRLFPIAMEEFNRFGRVAP